MTIEELRANIEVHWRGEIGTVIWVQGADLSASDACSAVHRERLRDYSVNFGHGGMMWAGIYDFPADKKQRRALVRLDERSKGGRIRYAWALPRVLRPKAGLQRVA